MEFETKTLNEVSTVKNGKKTNGKLVKGKYPIYGSNGLIGYSNESNADANTIIIGRVGANCGSVHFSDEKMWISDNAIAVAPNDNTDPYFLFYLLSTTRLNELASGSAQPLINQSILNSIPLLIPEFKQQKYIGNILKNFDMKIKVNNNKILLLEQLAQTLFKHWFVDFEFPNEDGEPYKSSGGAMVESELGMIPVSWSVIVLGDVCDANMVNLSKKNEWSFINYLDTGNITNNIIENIKLIDLKEEKIPSRAKRKVQSNDIVYSTVRPNQKHYGIIKNPIENMIVSTGFAVLRSKGMYSNDLIYLWLTQSEMTDKLQSIAEQSTSAYPSIKAQDILAMKVLMPSANELNMLSEVIQELNGAIWRFQHEIKSLVELRDTLLPKLLSGEIELPDETEVTERVPVS